MNLSWLKAIVSSRIFFFSIFVFSLSTNTCLAVETIAPDRNISVLRNNPATPEWKNLWDEAREFARAGDFVQSAFAYSKLFKIKTNIEEANWEYCKVLLKIEDYATADKILDGLLEKKPNRSEYLLAGGAVALEKKDFAKASHYYGKIFESDPAGENSDIALEGLAVSLRKKGETASSFSLFELLLARQPENNKVIYNLALDAQKLGRIEKARKLFNILLENPEVGSQIIFQAAQAYDVPGFEREASELWAKYLAINPDYIPFRKRLVSFHIDNREYDEALHHLTYLSDNAYDNTTYLLQAANVLLKELKRPDKALSFLERYSKKFPYNLDIKQKITNIQSTLANDFLSIVENDGASLLWEDLESIAPNRLPIYREIAVLLEKRGKFDELLEVLTIIFENSPPDDILALRIAKKYYKIKKYSLALKFFNQISKSKRDKNFYLFKGNAELLLGRELDGLSSFEQALLHDPSDIKLRKSCVDLAGKTGLISLAKKHFDSGIKNNNKNISSDFVLGYLNLLSFNYLFQEYEKVNDWARHYFEKSLKTLKRLELHKIAALRQEGKKRKAEQLLRKTLSNETQKEKTLFTLAENAVGDKKFSAAVSWYDILLLATNRKEDNFYYDELGCRLLLLKIKILRAKGEYDSALEVVNSYLKRLSKKPVKQSLGKVLFELGKERCWLNYYEGKYQHAYDVSVNLLAIDSSDPEVIVIKDLISRKLNVGLTNKQTQGNETTDENKVLSRLLKVAQKELEIKEYESATKHLHLALKSNPSSVAGKAVRANLLAAQGQIDDASLLWISLAKQYPTEPYFYRKLIEVEALQGRHAKGIALLRKAKNNADSIEELTSNLQSGDEIGETLTLARLLWGDKNHELSLQLYRQLLTPSVLDLLNEEFREKQIDYHFLTREDTVWNSMMLLLQSEPEIIDELMDPSFLFDNRGNETGKIVAEYFDKYSWQKLIRSEYLARKAIYERNYYYAEQSYKRLLKEEKSTEGMLDLASIYSRIGKYRKEAKVYEEIQSKGATSPELDDSIERTSLQLSPQSIFSAQYHENSGRDGFFDMRRMSFGTSFWITPDLDKDIRLLYANNTYESVDTDEKTGSNLLYLSATYEFAENYELKVGGGTEKLNSESDSGFIYGVELKGQLDDYISAYALFEKKPVYDTVAAVKEQVNFQAVETGLNCETPMGIAFGGDLRHSKFNDGNSQNRFHGYSSYSIFSEFLQLALRYDIQYLNNNEENISEEESPVDISSDSLLYWSPSSYLEHRMTLHFQQDFLGYQQGTKRGMSYYSIDNAVGIEDDDNLSYIGSFDIFLEMNPRFLLKGNFTLSKSEVFEEKELSLSLHYRW